VSKLRYYVNKVHLWWQKSETVLSMNNRNLGFIYPSNLRKHYQLADDKLLTKQALAPLKFGLAETYKVYQYFFELNTLAEDLASLESFVIKPAQGSGGHGIMVIVKKREHVFITASGKQVTLEEIKKHIGNIIFGIYATALNDKAIIEECLVSHEDLADLNQSGLSDVRLLFYKQELVLAMLRLATQKSDGKANLHQGGIGVGIDLQTGKTNYAQIRRSNISHHPDNGTALLERKIPQWLELVALAKKVSENIPLDYLGIDIALTTKGPVVLEVNARPGIEIQNINLKGIRTILEDIS